MDTTNMRLFFKLLTTAQGELKKEGCHKVRVWCTKHDWDRFISRTRWARVDDGTVYQQTLQLTLDPEQRCGRMVLTEVDIDEYVLAVAEGCNYKPPV